MAKRKSVKQAAKTGCCLAILAVIASVISAFYYLKPVAFMYFKDQAKKDVIVSNPESIFLYVTLVFCLVAILALGLKPDLYLPLAKITLN